MPTYNRRLYAGSNAMRDVMRYCAFRRGIAGAGATWLRVINTARYISLLRNFPEFCPRIRKGGDMYHVVVIRNDEAIDTRNFEIGTFVEIGYWLDYYGYIESDCKVVITITA